MGEAKQRFPQDMDYVISLDTTQAVTAGIKEIVLTLLIAIALVILVIYLFLQDWRATLIPLLAVPVSLVGTFLFFPLFGFSINTLSMFGFVLAIGLVVDDAIVVVEGVQRHIEEGLAPKDAARKAMEELTSPVIGIAVVLSAAFLTPPACPRASCPMKTRATSSSTCSSQMRLRLSERQRHRDRLSGSSQRRPASSTPPASPASACSALSGPVTTPSISSH